MLISEIFEASNKTYGYRRIKLALQNFYEVKIAYKTVVKLMKELHIVCKVRKKRYRYISLKYLIKSPLIYSKETLRKTSLISHVQLMYRNLDLIVNDYFYL